MPEFHFLQNPITKKWVILAPRRAKRPDIAKGVEPVCPFCPGREKDEKEVYRISGITGTTGTTSTTGKDQRETPRDTLDTRDTSDWVVRVIPNKFPFAPNHEVIIHSQDHHKSFGELPLEQVERILQTYRHRYNEHAHKGQVYIFHNHAKGGGESLPHPHTQLVVVPEQVQMDIPTLGSALPRKLEYQSTKLETNTNDQKFLNLENSEIVSDFDIRDSNFIETDKFVIFCPATSQWPDEVWIAPKVHGRVFGEITDEEIKDLANVMNRLIHILDLRHGHEFPFNFYIYPGGDWYLRLVPRDKGLGGFEVGTGVFINTQDPKETIAFLKEHFNEPNIEKIASEGTAEYSRHV